MAEHFTFGATELFTDSQTRTIHALVVPADGVAQRDGINLSFAPNSVEFGDRTPALMYHDTSKPVGRMTESQWTERGLEAKFSIAKTNQGDECLELASQGILGLSLGCNITQRKLSKDGTSLTVLSAQGVECSFTPTPAFAGANVDSVQFQQESMEAAMPTDDTNAAMLAALTSISEKLDRPVVVPTPIVKVQEQPLYNLTGPGGQHNFSHDMLAMVKGDGAAHARLDAFVTEQFANGTMASADVAGGQAPVWKPEMGYNKNRPYNRALADVVTRGSLTTNQPFFYPIVNAVTGTLVNSHSEGVEPALSGNMTWTSQTVTPTALDAKFAVTRETIDRVGSMASDFLWAEVLKSLDRAAESRLIALLDSIPDASLNVQSITGTNATLLRNLDTMRLSLLEPGRFGGAVLPPTPFANVYLAEDSNGRRLASAFNPVNNTGSASLDAVTASGAPTFRDGIRRVRQSEMGTFWTSPAYINGCPRRTR